MTFQIGSSIRDRSRPELGRGVVQSVMEHSRQGRLYVSRFVVDGVPVRRHVRAKDARRGLTGPKPKEPGPEDIEAAKYGLTLRQYREAIG